MKEIRKKKLVGRMGVVCVETYHVSGENANKMNAFLFFNHNNKTRAIKKIQTALINFIVSNPGRIFKKGDMIRG